MSASFPVMELQNKFTVRCHLPHNRVEKEPKQEAIMENLDSSLTTTGSTKWGSHIVWGSSVGKGG